MWNYEKLSAKVLVSSVRVIDTVGFLSVFLKSFTQATIKIRLNHLAFMLTYVALKLEIQLPGWHLSFDKRIESIICEPNVKFERHYQITQRMDSR